MKRVKIAAVAALLVALVATLGIVFGTGAAHANSGGTAPARQTVRPAAGALAIQQAEELLAKLNNIAGNGDGKIDAAERDIKEADAAVNGKMQKIRENQSVLENRSAERFGSIDAEDIKTRRNAVATEFEAQSAAQSAQTAEGLQKDIAAAEQQILLTGADLNKVQATLAAQQKKLDEERAELAGLTKKVENGSEKVKTLRQNCENLEAEIKRLTKQIPDLQSELTALQREYAQRFARAARKAGRTFRDDLTDATGLPFPTPRHPTGGKIPSPSVGGKKLW